MTDRRVVIAVAIVAAALTYGSLAGAESLLAGEGGAATDGEVAVHGTSYHLDRAGRPTVVGEVRNSVGGPVTNATVTVTFFRDGERIGRASGATLRPTIPAGEAAPFDVHLDEATEADDYAVAVAYDRGGSVVPGLAVAETAVADESPDQVTVTATVENRGNQPRRIERVVATFYGANRTVVGARVATPGERLSTGETRTVRLTFRTLGDVPSLAREFVDFDVRVVAGRAE